MRSTAAPFMKLVVGCAALLIAAQLDAAEFNPARHRPAAESQATAERFIVKFKGSAPSANLQIQAGTSGESAALTAMTNRVQALAGRARVSLEAMRPIGPTIHMMKVKPLVAGESAEAMLARLRADPDVEYAVPDRRVYLHATPSDPRFGGEWYLQNAQPSAINAAAAWDITKGSTSVVIAVVDTGVRYDHEDLKATSAGGKLLPGFDFISADPDSTFFTANDGNGRDSDPSDPGDFVTTAEASAHSNCDGASNSSWHGTRVSGIIGALTDNATGVAGINWDVRILPARVIGKCGGFNSDVVAGIRWAAGLPVPGVTPAPTPAKIINVSLGGTGPCDSASADAVRAASEAGALVVVSAGNEGGPVDSPANCPGAAAIAGLRHIGSKVGFSSLGPEITVGAPGGNCVNTGAGDPCLFSIDTTTNTGTTTPVAGAAGSTYTDQINFNVGTSFSAPIVSGIAGLMLAVNSNLKSPQLIARLKEGAKPYPTTSDTVPAPPVCHVPTGAADVQSEECICTTAACGAGMANALGSVNAALRPVASIVVQGTVSPGATLTLQGGGSGAAVGHTISSFSWVQGGVSLATGSTASITAPTSGTKTACLTVTDETGKQDTAKLTLTTTNSSVEPVAPGADACNISEVSVAATDASAAEAGQNTGTFTFTRTGDVAAALNVNIAMSGSATNGTDYNTIAGNVAFAAGQATTVATITPIDDSAVDGSESVVVTIATGTGYVVGSPSSATITIADNDSTPAPTVSPPMNVSGGGGGGALDWLTLLVSLVAVATAMMARKRQRSDALVVWRRATRRRARRD